MFKVNNRDTRCLYCELWTYFTPCSSIYIANFEHVITGSTVPKPHTTESPISKSFPATYYNALNSHESLLQWSNFLLKLQSLQLH